MRMEKKDVRTQKNDIIKGINQMEFKKYYNLELIEMDSLEVRNQQKILPLTVGEPQNLKKNESEEN